MLISFVLFFVVAYARPIGPIPPIPDPTPDLGTLNTFESPLYTPLIPELASPIVDDIDIDRDIDVSYPPKIPESSYFPVISFMSTPSVSASVSASLSAHISPAPTQSSLPDVSATPPTLVTPSSTPITSHNSPSPPPTFTPPPSSPSSSLSPSLSPSPSASQFPKIRETPPENAPTNSIPATETSNHLEGDNNRRATNPPSTDTTPTSPPNPPTSAQNSPQLPTNNPRDTDGSNPPMQPELPSLGPDGLPTPSPLPPPIMSQRITCFPASSTVTLKDGSVIPMRQLAIGDFVHVGNGQFSSVHMFTHRVHDVQEQFLRFITDSRLVLTVSDAHYLYVGTVLKPARNVVAGDYLPLGEGGFTRVQSVHTVFERGLYNPQTVAGDIVVDGIKTSVYTEAVQPALAHAALLPLRVAFSLFGITTQFADQGFPESVPLTLRSLLSAR